MYDNNLFADVKARLNIVDVCDLCGLELKRSGRRFVCCCPVHAEETPSCTIYPEDGNFHCYGCHAHGDAIELFRQVKGYPKPIDAARELAHLAGIPVKDYNPFQAHSKPIEPQKPSTWQVEKFLDKWEMTAFRAALWGREQCSVLLRTYSPETAGSTFQELLKLREQCETLADELTAKSYNLTLQERGEQFDYWQNFAQDVIRKFDWGDEFERLDRAFANADRSDTSQSGTGDAGKAKQTS